jgi:glycosyltransferase involved in cell wall biosynthesis
MDLQSPDVDACRVPDHAPGRWTDRIAGWFRRDWYAFGRACGMIIRAARARLRSEPFEVLEMEDSYGWAGPVARALDVPVVARLHGPWILAGVGSGLERQADFADRVRREGEGIRAVAGITSPTRIVLESVRRHYELPLERAIIVPYCQPLPPESECWRPTEAIPDLVLFVGRFDRVKGGDLVLEAFRTLAQRRPQARLVFVGPDRGFLDEKGRTWSMTERIREVLGPLADRVRWTGELPRQEIPALRRQASAVVVASRSEPFGYTAAEALASACPLVVSDAGGLPEIVQHGVNGLIFPSGRSEALALQVERLLADPGLGARLGAQGRRDVGERYDPDRLAQRTLEYHGECRAQWQAHRG